MATVNVDQPRPNSAADAAVVPAYPQGRSTNHLKLVPEARSLREQLRRRCTEVAGKLDKSRPLCKDEMEALVRATLDSMGLPEGFVGWTMVALAAAFWKEHVAAVPFNRRLLLLPQGSAHAQGCPAGYDELRPDGGHCGACSIANCRTTAETLGYRVLVADGSATVLKMIVSGHVDAIVGVACLNVLEKAIDKILLAGIPCLAVPLLSSDGRNAGVDEDWVAEMIQLRRDTPAIQTRTYVHLLRRATDLFKMDELERLAPRLRGGPRLAELNGHGPAGLDPIAGTEAIAYDFLAKGGKHSRPFITLAVYDALTGAHGTSAAGAAHVAAIPDAVRRTALSIETFHKASLVHDDIEDDDPFRYGAATLHRQHSLPTALNVGDYLIGLGYRLVSREAKTLGPAVAADILDRLADAHMKLCEGQGAELLWRDSHNKRLTPLDALKIYALKTAPAFEAALYAGLRLAREDNELPDFIAPFSRHLGVAFQILNDLNDWHGDNHNKLLAVGDILGGRPTVLWALALEGLGEEDRRVLESLIGQSPLTAAGVARIRALYERAAVFDKAARLVEKYRERAEAVADEIPIEELRRLLYFLVDTVLDRQPAEAASGFSGDSQSPSRVVARP